jgi:hypothetical protein
MCSVDLSSLPQQFSPRLPYRSIAAFLFVVGGFLLLAWTGRIIPGLFGGPLPVGLDTYTTIFVQVADLGLVMPVAFLSGILLLRRRPIGYLLASVVLVKGFTMMLAIDAMIIGQAVAGVDLNLVEGTIFASLSVVAVSAFVVLLRNIAPRPITPESRSE